jgi:glycosyltransferase involved in cell wall biosynthesis
LTRAAVIPCKSCSIRHGCLGKIAQHHPDLELVLAGPDRKGMGSALRVMSRKLGISERIHFPGMIEGETKARALRAAEAFILPSHQENFGIAVAEALAQGTPVLVSDQVNIWREVLADGAGLVAPDTLAGTRDLLTRFLALSREERAATRERALHCFEHRFDLEHAAGELLALVEREIR